MTERRSSEAGRDGEGVKKNGNLSFLLFFSFKSLPEGLEMTPLTTAHLLTPLCAMAPRDGGWRGRGFADLPEKLKAPTIFS